MCALTSALRTREGSFEGHAHEARRAFARIPGYAHYCPRKMRYLSSSLRRKPESRLTRAWRSALLPGSRPTPGRQQCC